MEPQEIALQGSSKTTWLTVVIIALIIEKIIQHVFVTMAFFFNWGDIRTSVAVNPDLLMVLGAAVTVLFMHSLYGMLTQKPWAPVLVAGLALFDILGEFVAQGRIGIAVNISFTVAIILFVLAIFYRREQRNELTA
jgi:hypothetical protein